MNVMKKLAVFLHNSPTYFNPKGLQLYMNEDGSFIIAANYADPDTKRLIFLEFSREVASIEELAELFNITEVEQIDHIQPHDLLNLFYAGKVSIVCIIDGYLPRTLSFNMTGDKLFTTDSLEITHEVKSDIKLSTPESYIDYTLKYYRVNGS